MKAQRKAYIKNIIVPGFLFSAAVGVLTGALIFLFKFVSSKVIHFSEHLYATVRENPSYLLQLVLGAAALGLAAALLLRYAKECRGGGIPTALASIRGLVPLKWLQGIFALFASAMLTYLGGVPLGNEGPSVQMGTAVGKGVSSIFGKKKREWERYVMTGGACAGFASATGAPLTGILFALEEAHRRFSPMIFTVASVSVVSGTATQALLSELTGIDTTFFGFVIHDPMPLRYLWLSLIIGAACGGAAILLSKLYQVTKRFSVMRGRKIPFTVKVVVIFVSVAFLGFLSADFIGSGHELIESIIEGHGIWYLLLAALPIRAILMVCANSEGVTGGVFVPTLAFGALLATLITDGFSAAISIPSEYYAVFVAVGMSSFLAASSRTPITSLAFAAEVLCGVHNLLPIGVGVVVAYLIVEISGITDMTDAMIESKAEAAHEGKTATIVDVHMTVAAGAFAVGHEIRDILWPPTCAVLSIDKTNSAAPHDFMGIGAGDVLHLHYQTYDPVATRKMLTYILGDQPGETDEKTHSGSHDHIVPFD